MHCIKIIISGNFQDIKRNIKIICFIASDFVYFYERNHRILSNQTANYLTSAI